MSFNDDYIKIKKLVAPELEIIEQKMVNPINIQEPLKTHVINFLKSPSKRIRLTLAILLSKALEEELSNEQLELLSAIEIVHNASLIHDDIIDDCEIRRGHKTISAEFNNKLGVISGDYLLSIAMEKIGELNSIEILKEFSHNIKKMCIGEINQNFNRYKIGTIEEYIEKSKDKTGYLFETAIICNLLLSSKTSTDKFKNFGLNVGIAFQIRDDLLNILSTDTTKPSNNDIEEGIYNAPIIYSGDPKDLTSGIEKTRSLLNNYVQEAEQVLINLKDNQYTIALKKFLELLKDV